MLGNGCALFLAKFLCELLLKYNKLWENITEGVTTLQNRINYKKALEETLLNFAVEDMTEHGRLLSIKEMLVSLLDSEDFLDTKYLSLF